MKHMESQEIQWNENLDELPCGEVVLFTFFKHRSMIAVGSLMPDKNNILSNNSYLGILDFVAWARIKPHVPAKT
jgi:hypothetical protein